MAEDQTAVQERVDGLRARIASACARVGRPVDSVQLMAVSKTRSPDEVEAVARCGVDLFGENRVREAAVKIPLCSSRLTWHLIGHLQSNKTRVAVQLFNWIHSVDSISLLERLDRVAGEEGRRPVVLLEVNVSGEASKFGLAPDAVLSTVQAGAGLVNLEIRGLMTIPPQSVEPERTRGFFRALRELRDRVQTSSGLMLPELSMGMSGDFEIAVEEGATIVRVGTDLFGPRSSPPPMEGEDA